MTSSTRRDFCAMSALTAAAALLPTEDSTAQINVQGFTLSKTAQGWQIGANDIQIGGVKVPFASWAWLGIAIAQGVLAALGGEIVSVIVSLLTQKNQPDLGALLKQQLDAIANIIVDAQRQALAAQAAGALDSDMRLLREYENTPSRERLNFLVFNTSATLGLLKQIDYAGYRTFMQVSGLRLAILQDLVGKDGKRAVSNFTDQRNESIDYHRQMIDLINLQTEPSTHFPQQLPSGVFAAIQGQVVQTVHVFGKTVSGKVKYSPHPGPPPPPGKLPIGNVVWTLDSVDNVSAAIRNGANDLIDWQALRQQLKAESTNLGAALVEKWQKASPYPTNASGAKRKLLLNS